MRQPGSLLAGTTRSSDCGYRLEYNTGARNSTKARAFTKGPHLASTTTVPTLASNFSSRIGFGAPEVPHGRVEAAWLCIGLGGSALGIVAAGANHDYGAALNFAPRHHCANY